MGDPEYAGRDVNDFGGYRGLLCVPLLCEGLAIGVLMVAHTSPSEFSEKQIALVKTFAKQAVIAIENARLLNELRESLQQQTATADVLKVISSSPGDLEPVFETMLANAVRICAGRAPRSRDSPLRCNDFLIQRRASFPQDITRALLNFISNGFYAATKRYAEANGGNYEPTLAAPTKNLGDRVEISIRDNGTGIPPDVKAKIFNPFFTTKPAGQGTGLGLSISHDIIVKQHGGSIEVDTQPGEFTEIRVILPRVAVSA
jgi:signal transduction histidine kinase